MPVAISPTAAGDATAARPSAGFAARRKLDAAIASRRAVAAPETKPQPNRFRYRPFAVEAKHDVLIVGAGCAGMRAAIEAFDAGADVALLSKIHPVRSHSGAA